MPKFKDFLASTLELSRKRKEGELILYKRPTNLSYVLQQMTNIINSLVHSYPIQITLLEKNTNQTPIIANIDPDIIEMAIYSIVHDIVSNNTDNIGIKIELERHEDDKVKITISDNGKLVSHEVKTACEYIKAHDGDMQTNSIPSKAGNIFEITIPCMSSHNPAVKRKSKKDSEKKQKTILIVDDEESLLNILVFKFKRLGYKTIGSAMGEEAVDLFEEHKDDIDAIISDLMMPDMMGIELLETLYIKHPLEYRKKVAFLHTGVVHECYIRDISSMYLRPDILPKPTPINEICEIVAQKIEEKIQHDILMSGIKTDQ